MRAHWFWRRVAYKDGIIPDEDKPPRDDDEKSGKGGQPASNNGVPNGNGKGHHNSDAGRIHDPTANDDASRRNAA